MKQIFGIILILGIGITAGQDLQADLVRIAKKEVNMLTLGIDSLLCDYTDETDGLNLLDKLKPKAADFFKTKMNSQILYNLFVSKDTAYVSHKLNEKLKEYKEYRVWVEESIKSNNDMMGTTHHWIYGLPNIRKRVQYLSSERKKNSIIFTKYNSKGKFQEIWELDKFSRNTYIDGKKTGYINFKKLDGLNIKHKSMTYYYQYPNSTLDSMGMEFKYSKQKPKILSEIKVMNYLEDDKYIEYKYTIKNCKVLGAN